LSGAPFGYQSLTNFGHREQRPHNVKIVSLNRAQEPEEIFDPHFCNQRIFMAKLIGRIEAAHPTMIVVDKFFSLKACEEDGPNNELRSSVLASPVPIVLGVQTLTKRDLERDVQLTDTEKNVFGDTCLVLAPKLDFDEKPSSRVTYGLTRL